VLALRFFAPEGDREAGDRVLIVNLGRDLCLASVAEPLLAPPAGGRWRTAWSSEEPRYGGSGTAPVETEEGLRLPGHAAIVLAPGA
jgi:maltooligosyltrehalose trehalohydrolase